MSELHAALARLQAGLPRIGKDAAAVVQTKTGGTYGYRYADLASVTRVLMPLLAAQGLSFTAAPTLQETGTFVLWWALRHEAGGAIEGTYPLPDPARTTPQQIGSAITYARRYCLLAVTGCAPDDDDDDAQAAQDTPPRMWLKEPETRPDGSATEAEQMRMVRGPVPGSERLRATPPDDPWYGDSPEAAPGSVTQQQLARIHALLAKAGITDREAGLSRLGEITGRPVGSSKELSFLEAERVKKELA